jgi:hypothetical protein
MAETMARRTPRFVYLVETANHALDGARAGWRLVAANNRPLGRAVQAYPSVEESRASAFRVHRMDGGAARSALFDPVAGVWTWSLTLDDVPIAVSVHPYLRRIECYRALQQFMAAAQQADPAQGVVRYFGPRTLREFLLVSP